MPEKPTNPTIRQFVFERAHFLCEYCCSPLEYCIQPFVIEHIIPISKHGTNDLDNLACACGGCNGHKYNKTEAQDTVDQKSVLLYHPRLHQWFDHFAWSADFIQIIGVSDTGRATIASLHLNRPGVLNIRQLLVLAGKHPPVY